MKFPDAISNLLGKKEEQKDFFFSLFLDTDAAAVAAWHVVGAGVPKIVSYAHGKVVEDSWEARVQVVDRLLSAVEDKAKVEHAISKTVFGMPGVYLTPEGNIANNIRPELKKLTTVLELTPVGFVPLSQAIAFSFKKDEGVPPSMILIGCSGKKATLTIFRVGKTVGEQVIDIADDPASEIEQALKQYQHSDVLPSRILLFGGDEAHIEVVRNKLLKHPWPTRANFLHFPKIEIFSTEKLLTAVSLSGASELAAAIGESDDGDISAQAASVVAQPTRTSVSPVDMPVDEEVDEAVEDETTDIVESDDVIEVNDSEPSGDNQEVPEDEDDQLETEEESNIRVVSPEALGFERQDILTTEHETHKKQIHAEAPSVDKNKEAPEAGLKTVRTFASALSTLPRVNFGGVRSMIPRMPRFSKSYVPWVVGLVLCLGVLGALYYFLPQVTVTVFVAPVSLEESTALSVDSTLTIADPASKIIPGRVQEKSISGEKTVAVTGKKKVGDPSRGTVTVYNKLTNERTLKKGTSLSAKGLLFTLDDDVSVASASESIGSITFGKANIAVTAQEIGAASNLPASTEFTFKDVSASSLSARNDAALAGGVSRDVTVVSRSDYDAIVKAMTDELVVKAKSEFSQQIGAERLIDQTVKTTVSEKVFDKELDEEAKELHGKITVTVSGISIRDEDVKAILTSLVAAKVPGGYSLSGGQTDVTTRGIQVKKDGKITLTATLKAVALPVIDSGNLVTKLVGKPVSEATDILKQTHGVAGVEYRFAVSPTTNRIPMNPKNITITLSVGQ